MSFFVSDAWAQGAPAASADPGMLNLAFLVVIFIIFYFLLIRPQVKRAKEQRKMIAALAKNDEVMTGGGLLGRISDINESFVVLEIAPGVEVSVQKNSITASVPKGTYKSK